MAEVKDVKKIKRWKSMSKRPMGRPKKRSEDDVLEDIKSMNVYNWKNVAQNRDRWKKVVEQARSLNRLWCFIRRITDKPNDQLYCSCIRSTEIATRKSDRYFPTLAVTSADNLSGDLLFICNTAARVAENPIVRR